MAQVLAIVQSQTVLAQTKFKMRKVALRVGHFCIHSGVLFSLVKSLKGYFCIDKLLHKKGHFFQKEF